MATEGNGRWGLVRIATLVGLAATLLAILGAVFRQGVAGGGRDVKIEAAEVCNERQDVEIRAVVGEVRENSEAIEWIRAALPRQDAKLDRIIERLSQ